jgi:hypothetical protein
MSPREVDELTPAEYRAFVAYANREIRAQNRAAKRRR